MCQIWESLQPFFREIEKEIAKTPKSPLFHGIFVLIKFFKLIHYVFDLGSDNWIVFGLIEQCHFNYALFQFCLRLKSLLCRVFLGMKQVVKLTYLGIKRHEIKPSQDYVNII